MMLMAKDHFEIGVNVNIEEIKDASKKLPEYFQMILDRVAKKIGESENRLDVEILDKEPRKRRWKTKLAGKDVQLMRFYWTGIGQHEDIRKWADIWNEVEGMRGPCFFIHMNPNPLLRS